MYSPGDEPGLSAAWQVKAAETFIRKLICGTGANWPICPLTSLLDCGRLCLTEPRRRDDDDQADQGLV